MTTENGLLGVLPSFDNKLASTIPAWLDAIRRETLGLPEYTDEERLQISRAEAALAKRKQDIKILKKAMKDWFAENLDVAVPAAETLLVALEATKISVPPIEMPKYKPLNVSSVFDKLRKTPAPAPTEQSPE